MTASLNVLELFVEYRGVNRKGNRRLCNWENTRIIKEGIIKGYLLG